MKHPFHFHLEKFSGSFVSQYYHYDWPPFILSHEYEDIIQQERYSTMKTKITNAQNPREMNIMQVTLNVALNHFLYLIHMFLSIYYVLNIALGARDPKVSKTPWPLLSQKL